MVFCVSLFYARSSYSVDVHLTRHKNFLGHSSLYLCNYRSARSTVLRYVILVKLTGRYTQRCIACPALELSQIYLVPHCYYLASALFAAIFIFVRDISIDDFYDKYASESN